jgi:23S rRNA pseudouridine2604 synthase
LILTNDGYYFNKTINPASEVEKEYIVTVNKPITNEFISEMSRGVEVLGQITLECKTEKINDFTNPVYYNIDFIISML